MTANLLIRNNLAVIQVTGRFEFASHPDFRKCVNTIFETPGISSIEVDLRQVEYIDSSALGMLLVLKERAEESGLGRVSLSGAKGLTQQILSIANFERMFEIS
jgi:anti-anti-sigma factor